MPRSRTVLVGGLLALTLVLAAVLAAQVVVTARYHRYAAERALRDYSRFAAAEFSRRADEALTNATLWTVLRPALSVIPAPRTPLPPPSMLADTAYRGRGFDLRTARSVRTYFRVMLDGSAPAIALHGTTASPALQRWIADTVRVSAARLAESNRYLAAVTGAPDGEPLLLSYLVRSAAGNRPVVAYGFVVPETALAPIFAATAGTPFLPLARTGETPNDSLLSVEVRDATGRTVFRSSAAFDEAFAADSGLGWQQAGLVARASVRREAAGRIVIGGLPVSRLPLALGLLALTALLLGTAVFQLRRESELARLRSDFVANVSHELRTPLAQIRMFAETLLLGRVRSDAERTRSLEIIHRETGRLTHLVENLLAATREGGGTPAVVSETVDLGRLARDVVDAFAPIAQARGVQVTLDAPAGIEVPANPDMVRQILLNLLDNTVKHGPEGQEVRVAVAAMNGLARLTVEDQGPGIAPRDRERIFERFTRLRPDASAGAGIGLAVVKGLVARHQGTIRVEDAAAGTGARFVVEPAVTRILVVEDNTDLAFGLRNNLEIEGYTVDVAASGDEGLARAQAAPPDLVVLDLMLPGMDGFRVLKAMRAGGLAMPVLILTARGEESDKVRGLKLGADDYVTKPFGVLELLARVEALLRRARGGEPGEVTRFGDVVVDAGSRTVTRGGRAVDLPPKAYDLLAALIARRGAVARRHELLREVWGYDAAVVSRTVDTHMAELRKRLEGDPARPRYLLTARKAGYRLAAEAPGSSTDRPPSRAP